MGYKLKAYYTTGNSFGSQETSDIIHVFESKEVAIAAMHRLQEHYKWYDWCENKTDYQRRWAIERGEKPVEEPEWHKDLEYDFQVSFYLDNGELLVTTAPYCGYFETLHSLEIKEKGNKVKFN